MSNYQAIIAKVNVVVPIDGADRIQIGKVLGENVIISKEIPIGTLGVFFCSGTQLSTEYCHHNNLFRDKTRNKDPERSGFFEESRRVRAQPFLKVKSEAYFAPLESLSFAGDITKLKEGDRFEDLNDIKICTKFLSERALKALANRNKVGKPGRKKVTSTPFFREHVESSQFRQNLHVLTKGDLISIQSKRHGTSGRYGFTKVVNELSKWQRIINSFLPIFKNESYEYVVGSRRVVLTKFDGSEADKVGFHGPEAFRFEVMEELKPHLTKGMEIYVEIVGFANTKPIMSRHSTKDLKDKAITKKYGETITYSYGCNEAQYKFHIYRVSLTTEDGNSIDLTQTQLVEWCSSRGFDVAHDIIEPFIYDGNKDKLIELVDNLTERPDVLTEDYHDPSHPSEGVIVRVDRGTQTPLFLKNKSYIFKVLEGLVSDDAIDLEDIS